LTFSWSGSRPGYFATGETGPRYPLDRRPAGHVGHSAVGLDDMEKWKFLPRRDSNSGLYGRPAYSQSLYRLQYPVYRLLDSSVLKHQAIYPSSSWSSWITSSCRLVGSLFDDIVCSCSSQFFFFSPCIYLSFFLVPSYDLYFFSSFLVPCSIICHIPQKCLLWCFHSSLVCSSKSPCLRRGSAISL
jgi:hypothetical protein